MAPNIGIVTAIQRLGDAITSNSLAVGVISFTEAIVEKITAASGKDLEIYLATGKDGKIIMTDTAGARDLGIINSSEVKVISMDSAGTIKAKKIVAPISYATAATDGAPTNAECISAFGAAATVGAGFIGVLQDTETDGVSYLCVSNGTNYDVITGAAAA